MIVPPTGIRVWLANGHTAMRRGMNGLVLQVQEALQRDPHAGDLYVFRGRGGDLVKILWHDGLGMSLYARRLERGRFLPSRVAGFPAIKTLDQFDFEFAVGAPRQRSMEGTSCQCAAASASRTAWPGARTGRRWDRRRHGARRDGDAHALRPRRRHRPVPKRHLPSPGCRGGTCAEHQGVLQPGEPTLAAFSGLDRCGAIT